MLTRSITKAPISRKLTLLMQTAVGIALLGVSAAAVVSHVRVERESLAREVAGLANVLSDGAAQALVAGDGDSAAELLESLHRQSRIEAVALYDAAGQLVAELAQDEQRTAAPPAPSEVGVSFARTGLLDAAQEIAADGQVVGTLCITANLDSTYVGVKAFAQLVAIVAVVACAAAHVLTTWLRRSIVRPILALTNTAGAIAADGDFSIRVERTSRDEIGELYDQFNGLLDKVQAGRKELQDAHAELEESVKERTGRLSEAIWDLNKQVAERSRAEVKLERVHREFVEAARSAGMAEVASGVLHNVGNVLNSVNVAASTISGNLRSKTRKQLGKLAGVVGEHESDFGDFVTNSQSGQQLPKFIKALSSKLESEDDALMSEASALCENIEHIKSIISTQQTYAGSSGLVEPVDLNDLLEDGIRLNSASFSHHQVTIERDFSDLPPVLVDKQRLLQIVINLVKNAQEALAEPEVERRVLTIHTSADDELLRIACEDSGVGIAPDDLTRVFSHGFTTKPEGHGFGLHSCANAATEMGGELTAESDGPMQGARFVLTLPFKPVTAPAANQTS